MEELPLLEAAAKMMTVFERTLEPPSLLFKARFPINESVIHLLEIVPLL